VLDTVVQATHDRHRFWALANVSPIGIFEADLSGCCTFMNPVWETICQQPVANALGFGWLNVVHPDDRARLAEPPTWRGAPIEQRFRIVRPGGDIRSVRVRLGSLQSADGKHIGWSGTFEDVTDALRDADALCMAGRQQEAVAALGLMALGGMALAALLEEAVTRAAEALGDARVEVMYANVAFGLDEAAITAVVDDPEQHITGIVATPSGARFEARDTHFLQAVANIISAMVHRERLDVRARRRARWLRAYFDRSPDVVLRLDAQARVLDINPAGERMTGTPAGVLRGRSSQHLGLSDSAFGAWRIAVAQVYASRHDQTLDLQLATADGSRTCVAHLTAVADEDGVVEFVGVILRDVTDRARAEDALKQLQHEMLERDDRLQALVGSLIGERLVLRDRARAWGIAALTARERTILRLLANGRTNREIAARLGLSAGTVKNRIGLLLPKLGAADRTQAVAIALQLGLLDGPAEEGAPEPRPLPYYNLGDFE
jgi:PAS domain S-box-containing protein